MIRDFWRGFVSVYENPTFQIIRGVGWCLVSGAVFAYGHWPLGLLFATLAAACFAMALT